MVGALVTWHTEKVEIINSFFASVFTDKIDLQIDLQESQAPENIGEDWSKDLPSC